MAKSKHEPHYRQIYEETAEAERSLQSVIAVQCRHFIGFRKRWVIHHVINEVFNRSTVGDYGLADMNELGGTLADNMDAE